MPSIMVNRFALQSDTATYLQTQPDYESFQHLFPPSTEKICTAHVVLESFSEVIVQSNKAHKGC